MPDVKPTVFKKFDATYSVSADGYCIRTDTGFFMRCVTSDSREPFYQMAVHGKKKRVSVRLAVSTAWNKLLTITDERAQEMRVNADIWNSEERPGGKRKYNYEERRKWKKPRPTAQECFTPMNESIPCPWATPGKLGLGPEGVSWYSAQADPMTRGVWLEGNLETVRAKEVAA